MSSRKGQKRTKKNTDAVLLTILLDEITTQNTSHDVYITFDRAKHNYNLNIIKFYFKVL